MSTTGSTTLPIGDVEALLTYGGDYSLDGSGDLAIVIDTPNNPAATAQRVLLGILTDPAMANVTNTAISEPDDIFYWDYGSGARAYVGRNASTQNLAQLKANVLNFLAADSYIAVTPAATVTFTQGDGTQYSIDTILMVVEFWTVYGQQVTLPSIPVNGNFPFGGNS